MVTTKMANIVAPLAIAPLENSIESESLLRTYIQEISRGNEEAMAQLYDATRYLVYGLSLRILGDPTAADDVTIEVYLQVWRQAKAFNEVRGTPSVWLITITRSRAIDSLRQRNNQRARFESLEKILAFPAKTETPERITLFAERGKNVRVALATLSPAQREVLTLAYYFGMTQTEIASKLGIPLGTIKTRARHGLKHLRKFLES